MGAERQVVKRGEELSVREIAARAEHDDRARLGHRLRAQARPQRIRNLVVLRLPRHRFRPGAGSAAGLTAWPPNSLRSAACTFALNDSSWREAIRPRRESVIT